MKICVKCQKVKPDTSFPLKGDARRRPKCRACWRAEKPSRKGKLGKPGFRCSCGKITSRASGICRVCHMLSGGCGNCDGLRVGERWCVGCKAVRAEEAKQKKRQERKQIIELLSGACEFCGVTNVMFLTVDHKNGDGKRHRREIREPSICRWLFRQLKVGVVDFGDYRLLCWSCNSARHIYGDEVVLEAVRQLKKTRVLAKERGIII